MRNPISKLLLTCLLILFVGEKLVGQTNEPAYVIGPSQDTLWVITAYSGIFSPNARAEAIQTNLERIQNDSEWDSKKLILENRGQNIDLVYKGFLLSTVQAEDTVGGAWTRVELAEAHRQQVIQSLNQYYQDTSLLSWLKKIGLVALVLLGASLCIRYLTKLFHWITEKIEAEKDKTIQGIRWGTYALVDPQRQVTLYLGFLKFGKFVLFALLVYLALTLIFGLFPQSQDLAKLLFQYILDPLELIGIGLWDFFPNLVTILVISIVARYALMGINYLKEEIKSGKLTIPGFFPDWATPTYQIARVLFLAFTFVVIFPYLPGSDSPIFQGVSVFLGFLFTFGSAGSLSNIVAGIILTYMRLFQIGDRVRIGDTVGDVVEKNMLVTRIRTIKNELISIPNSTVMNSHTINYSVDAPEKGLILHTTLTIGYDVPWREVHQALLEAAGKTNFILKEPIPFVLQTSLDDFYISYQLNGYTKHPNQQASIYSELHQHIQDCCGQAGIEILSPHYRAVREGNELTIPPKK